MIRHWPLFLLVMTTAVFFKWGPALPFVYRLAQSLGYSVVTFVCTYAVLLVVQCFCKTDLELVSRRS